MVKTIILKLQIDSLKGQEMDSEYKLDDIISCPDTFNLLNNEDSMVNLFDLNNLSTRDPKSGSYSMINIKDQSARTKILKVDIQWCFSMDLI
jgi:hypothetical protein